MSLACLTFVISYAAIVLNESPWPDDSTPDSISMSFNPSGSFAYSLSDAKKIRQK